ncbi:MAG: folate-binding protein [Asticcacaulis sp.]|uniref:CAF17-like 4Fe-4S cluster assembly/insertion protein YgfZ n=1 Tax=Asticcacaulis sp. TaxID=1872648 RepID=UPI0039E691D3
MTIAAITALPHRGLIAVSGPDWARFLKGLCTAFIDSIVEETAGGVFHRLHYGAFLRPQGKMICDVLLHAAAADEIWLDVPLSERDELLAKLNMYRLRAKVTITALDHQVYVAFGSDLPEGFMADPRSSMIDSSFGFAYAPHPVTATPDDWRAFRYAHSLAEAGTDFGKDALYAIDANLDLLDAIDFHKGCYVGQELTSRMKRRGQIKNRILGFRYDGATPEPGAEILNIDKRAGEVLAAMQGAGLALMRIDRRDGELTTADQPITLNIPAWIAPVLSEATTD